MNIKFLAWHIMSVYTWHAHPEDALDSIMDIHIRSTALHKHLMGASFVGPALPPVEFVPHSEYGFVDLILSRRSPVDALASWTPALTWY